MDRTIVIEVNGSYIRKDSDVAGVRGEANSTIMNIIFDESWEGYAKKVTFWDARGENPVERTLTTDLLTDITVSTLDYSVPIPGEPLVHQGTMTFVIDGFTDGVRKRSASDKLKVKYSPMADTAEEPADPTPTQAEQLQKQIDTMLGDMQAERILAEEAKNTAVNAAEEATASADKAQTSEGNSAVNAEMAASAAALAVEAKTGAESAKEAAEKIKEDVIDAVGGDFISRPEFSEFVTDTINPLAAQVGTNTSDIDKLKTDVSKQTTDINNLGQAISANTTAIGQKASKSELEAVVGAIGDHASNTDIHVTLEEKAKWNDGGSASKVVKNVTIPASGWIDETETMALFRYRISNASIVANTSVDVLFKVDDYTEEQASSLVRATNGGVLNATTSDVGYVDIYSTAQLDTDLVCDLVLTQLKVV